MGLISDVVDLIFNIFKGNFRLAAVLLLQSRVPGPWIILVLEPRTYKSYGHRAIRRPDLWFLPTPARDESMKQATSRCVYITALEDFKGDLCTAIKWGYVGHSFLCRLLINKPLPLNGDYSKDPNIKALKRRGFINHGSTLRALCVANPWPQALKPNPEPETLHPLPEAP